MEEITKNITGDKFWQLEDRLGVKNSLQETALKLLILKELESKGTRCWADLRDSIQRQTYSMEYDVCNTIIESGLKTYLIETLAKSTGYTGDISKEIETFAEEFRKEQEEN
jgi:hypothetical protein